MNAGESTPKAPQQRQQEDPHSSDLHHTYELGRDDLRYTPRCPQGHTFEDCTCGGAA